jgi:drug/metabolite transporter (DMT)-like permease
MATLEANIALEAGPAERTPSRVLIALSFIAIYIIWGSTYLAIRYAVQTIPPLITVGIRHSIAGLVLFGVAWIRGFRPSLQHWVSGVIVGALFFFIGHGTLHWAEQYVDSGLAALLVATEPLWILLLGSFMGQEKINWRNATGLLVGLAGVGILCAPGANLQRGSVVGMAAVLLGAFAWAAGVCVSPKLKLPVDAVGRAAVPLVCGAVMLLTTAAFTGEFHALHWSSISRRSAWGLFYLIVLGSIVAFTAYTWLLEHCPPTLVATHTYANPIVAVLLGWWLAGEPLSWRLLTSTAAILGAILLIRWGEERRRCIED